MHSFRYIPQDLHPDLQRFLDYWIDKCGDRKIPKRDAIDPLEIRDLLPGICILELASDQKRFCRARFRLAGTELRQMAGMELTGRYVDEVMPEDVYSIVRTQFQWMMENLEPVFRRYQWPSETSSDFVYERILAPLGEPEEGPSQLIGMHVIAKLEDDAVSPPQFDFPVG